MKFVILSYMDNNEPRILFQSPPMIDEEVLDKTPLLMNIHKEEDFYIEPFGDYCSGNLLFSVPNTAEPNKKEVLQISIVISEGAINGTMAQELLNGFKKEALKIDEIFKAFYIRTNMYPDSQDKFNALRNLVFNFEKSFPEENVMQTTFTKNVLLFVFGLEQAGKTTIIKTLRNEAVDEVLPTINVEVSNVALKDFCLILYDAPGQVKFKELWQPYLNMNLSGLVFVLDVVHRMKYETAKEILFEIATDRRLLDLPLLVLFNKTDLVEPNIDILVQSMELNKFVKRPIKWFITSGIQNKNIIEAFTWLAQEISRIRKESSSLVVE